MRRKLSYKDLTRIALSSQVDFLSVNLVGNVNEEHVEEVIRDVIWLEDDLHLV